MTGGAEGTMLGAVNPRGTSQAGEGVGCDPYLRNKATEIQNL